MDIDDLRSFLVVARDPNIRNAALELHVSPSALSKAIRRLETSLNTPLFERSGKRLRLNDHGVQLRERAAQLVALAELTQSEFRGERQQIHCRIAGPAVLQWRFGPMLAQTLLGDFPGSGVAFDVQFEDAALTAVHRGLADFALTTAAAVTASLPAGLEAIELGSITMRLAAGLSHPLLQEAMQPSAQNDTYSASTAQVLEYEFACPDRSMFCGVARGARSDGWRDDKLPRKIRYWVEDLQLLTALVRSGKALAYLPDFALQTPGLQRVKVRDCPYECVEQCWLVWKPVTASGWQNRLITSIRSHQI